MSVKSSLLSGFLVISLAGSIALGCPAGDLDGDCGVDLDDLRIFAGQWLEPFGCAGHPDDCANLDGAGRVNMPDLALLAGNWRRQYSGITLVINEFMARNNSDSGIRDEHGDYDDWIEIYNYGDDAIDIGGMYLTDDFSNPTRWRIPENSPTITSIPSQGYLLIWADNETSEGPLHANFKLSADGEQIALFNTNGNSLIDSVMFGPQVQNSSYGRFPNGSDH